ncbi:hypothetical protein D3C75_1227380 [compost metagenome]
MGEKIFLNTVEFKLIRGINNYLQLLNRLGVTLPLVMMLSILNIKSFSAYGCEYTSDRANLIIEPFLIEKYDISMENFMHPIFNTLWNTFGWKESQSYDQEGNWNNT